METFCLLNNAGSFILLVKVWACFWAECPNLFKEIYFADIFPQNSHLCFNHKALKIQEGGKYHLDKNVREAMERDWHRMQNVT